MTTERPLGFWIITGAGLLLVVLLIMGQMMSFINYDFTVSMGLQEPVEIISEFGVAVNKGFGAGDTIVYLPLLLAGLIGLWNRKPWGPFTMISALAITVYWPVVCMFILLFAKGVPGVTFNAYISYGIMLSIITLYGVWGILYLYRKRNELVS